MPKKILMTPGAELENLRSLLNHLAQAVLAQLRELKSANAERASERLQKIVKNDEEIDALELTLDKVAKNFIELRAPLGPDFRYVLTTLDIARNLERIGDCIEFVARHICTTLDAPKSHSDGDSLVAIMIDQCLDLLEIASHSLEKRDLDLARKVPSLDDQVDHLKKRTYDMVVDAVRQQAMDVILVIEYVLIAGKLESIADIACHIAESVVFIVSAKQIRHQRAW